MNLTQNQIKALIDEQGNAKKCPECDDGDIWDMLNKINKTYIQCPKCRGEGKATITIPKEWVKREILGVETQDGQFPYRTKIKIQKYKIGEKIEIIVCELCKQGMLAYDVLEKCSVKLKIISETETTQTLVMA